jgi:hypothetical protein
MTEFKKKGNRMLFKIDHEGNVIRILNKEKLSVITVASNGFITEEARDEAFPSTEEEFTSAYNLALERIKNMQI